MLLSIVLPVYNEAETVPMLLQSLRHVLAKTDCEYELIFVDDGSRDETRALLQVAAVDPRVKVLGLSRNFGHQAAITAGLDFAAGDAVVVMDADLQDPPEILPDMVALYRQGFDVVSAQRLTREGEHPFRRGAITLFYSVIRRLSGNCVLPEVGDFRLFSRAAVVALRSFREQHRFIRGLVGWLGLKEVILPYHRRTRAAGTTKYPALALMRFAWMAISSFSALPLRMSFAGGALLTTAGFAYFAYVLYAKFAHRFDIPGWTSLVGLQVVFFGTTLMAIGLLGDYIGRIYEEAKGRPLYVLAHMINVPRHDGEVPRVIVLPARRQGDPVPPSIRAGSHGI